MLRHVVQILGLLVVDVAEHALGQDFREADDRVQRGAQLVRHVGQELALVAACHLELLALVLDLSEQPRVLDGDDRLVGEGLEQLHAGVGECGHVAVSDVDDADRLPGADHGHPDRAPHAPGPVDLPHRGRRPEIGLDVGEIEHRAVGDPPEVIGVPQGPGEPPSVHLHRFAREVVACRELDLVAGEAPDDGGFRAAQATGAVDDRGEHELDVGG
jgi:hypothetical protein